MATPHTSNIYDNNCICAGVSLTIHSICRELKSIRDNTPFIYKLYLLISLFLYYSAISAL